MDVEFITHFSGNIELHPEDQAKALYSGFPITNYRKVYWMSFFGILKGPSVESWYHLLDKQRNHYTELQKKYEAESPSAAYSCTCHPLSDNSHVNFTGISQNKQLQDEIQMDVERTQCDKTLFQKTGVQRSIERILYTWAKENSNLSYRQGMNEIVAILYMVVESEKNPNRNDNTSLYAKIYSSDFIEADTYILFENLMKAGLKEFYEPENDEYTKNRYKSLSALGFNTRSTLPETARLPKSALLVRCRKIFHTVLKKVDFELFQHLVVLQIEPQIFLLKWLRLLFCREFDYKQLLSLWDVIFAYALRNKLSFTCAQSQPVEFLNMVDNIAVTILTWHRNIFLKCQHDKCLQALFGAPTIQDIDQFLLKAIHLQIFSSEISKSTPSPTAKTVKSPVSSCQAPSMYDIIKQLNGAQQILQEHFTKLPLGFPNKAKIQDALNEVSIAVDSLSLVMRQNKITPLPSETPRERYQ